MSLSYDEWKKVLDKPKNLGLKMVGTGVSKTLNAFQEAMNDHAKDIFDKTNRDKVQQSLKDVSKKCDEVIEKHQKLFTDACNYLKGVRSTAQESLNQFMQEEPKYAAVSAMRTRLKDLEKKLKAAARNDVPKLLDQVETNLKSGGASYKALESALKEFVKGRKEFDKQTKNEKIPLKIFSAMYTAIDYKPKMKK
jgi:hypothetical protein